MRLISQIPIANATANIKLPSGSYQDFMIHVSGTNGAVAATLADMGNVRDRKSTRLNSSHTDISRMPPSA